MRGDHHTCGAFEEERESGEGFEGGNGFVVFEDDVEIASEKNRFSMEV
jgi:hypothetical protein